MNEPRTISEVELEMINKLIYERDDYIEKARKLMDRENSEFRLTITRQLYGNPNHNTIELSYRDTMRLAEHFLKEARARNLQLSVNHHVQVEPVPDL